MNILNSLFNNEIIVDVSSEVFIFQNNIEKKSLPTFIWVTNEEKKIVLAVGESPKNVKNSIRVDLFSTLEISNEDRLPFLESFLKYAISGFAKGSKSIFRPNLVFKNADSLKSIMCGYHRSVLKLAAIHSGALDVKFI